MSPINENDKQSSPPNDADRPVEHEAHYERSWLDISMGWDNRTRRIQERAMAAEVFLQSYLFPIAKTSLPVDQAQLVDLLVDFKRMRPDLDVGFEMAHVNARLLSRFECYLIDDEGDSPVTVSDAMLHELDLYTSLADLDFQSIDLAVRERLHSD
jgi:hypothetical protein